MIYKCKYFDIRELVSPIVYNTWGERAWMFFNPDVLKELDYIRETYNSPIIINNWYKLGSLKQCGLRSNMDEIVKNKKGLYLSAHCLGCGFDLHCGKNNHRKLFDHVYNLIKNKKLKHFQRLENWQQTGTWVHVDCFQSDTIIF